MNRNELIASIMLEAAELLKNDTMDESVGANGAAKRYLDARKHNYDKEISRVSKKIKAFEKAGYGDKAPRSELDSLIAEKERIEKTASLYDTKKGRGNYWSKMHGGNTAQAAQNSKEYLEDRSSVHDIKVNKELHNRINKRAALKEAIDLLYEKALLCEDASDAEVYVEKAEELQKAIDDIPEEKPVVQDEYIPDVNGGEGEKLDLEEIKDLCDGDTEVMDLLLDDEDKSVTVDA